MNAGSRFSAWARRVVVVVACLATVATSPAKWHLAATLPPPLPAGPKGTLVTVEASQEPRVSGRSHGKPLPVEAEREERAPWAGRGTYYLAPGVELDDVSIGERCSGGLCSKCVAPPGASVRVATLEAVAAWSITVTSEEQTARVDSPSPASVSVEIDATRRAYVVAEPISGDVAAFGEPSTWLTTGTAPGPVSFHVGWRADGATPAAPLTVRWVAKATVQGFCRGEGACTPPAAEHVRIVSIK